MAERHGFTLIELVVAMAILLILIAMSFSAFSFVNTFSRARQDREAVLENISIILDQLTKEIRQTITVEDGIGGTGNFGVKYPAYSSSSDMIRDLKIISTPSPPLSPGQYYQFGSDDTEPGDDPLNPILQFYIIDDTGLKHRISYTLGVPNDGGGFTPPHYKGTPQQYWADPSYEPCEILYSNEQWNGIIWTGPTNQPITEQIITNFSVVRPLWSDNVMQIVIEATVKDFSGEPTKIERMAQVTLRQ